MELKHLRMNQTLNQFNRLSPPVANAKRPLSQQNLLFWVAAEATPPTPTALAEAMGLTKAAITKMLNPLIEDGLLTKTVDPADNRSFTLSVTETGKQAVRDLAGNYFQPMRTLHDGLGAEKFAQLLNLLDEANAVLIQENERRANPV
ncbi:MarR family winged helix-turn-helix transcriptional regulator [Lacticaseibacillus daqingensis]|uniref:MarR family winged helix-turn-helix transcriptional regulator n=1 Tax=Lacticaseibacillus daqingensis TaxID=2486014 RepID=UPI000F796C98|nr:MarR family winged helix-turn-helix transcriptional regulator [Lacticaseibacillus daqingensis]